MSSNHTNRVTGGITFWGALAILFIGLKLAGVIDWAWWLVLLPLYGGFVLIAVVFGLMFIAFLVAEAGKDRRRKKRADEPWRRP